jgi:hypothetical protein
LEFLLEILLEIKIGPNFNWNSNRNFKFGIPIGIEIFLLESIKFWTEKLSTCNQTGVEADSQIKSNESDRKNGPFPN